MMSSQLGTGLRPSVAFTTSLLLWMVSIQGGCAKSEGTANPDAAPSSARETGATFEELPSPTQTTISLELRDAPLGQIIEHYNSQARLPLALGHFGRPGPSRTSLSLDGVPTWAAIAEISKATGMGIQMSWKADALIPEVELTSGFDPVQRYVAQGPVLLVLRKGAGGEDYNSAFRMECYYDVREIDEVGEPALEAFEGVREGGSRCDVDTALRHASRGLKVWGFDFAPEQTGAPVRVRGELHANVRRRFRRVRFSTPEDGPLQASDARLALKVEEVGAIEGRGNPKLDFAYAFTLTWQTGLSEADEARLIRLAERSLGGESLSKEDAAWCESVVARMRRVELVNVTAYDRQGTRITPFMFERHASVPIRIEGYAIGDRKALAGGRLEIVCAEVSNEVIRFALPSLRNARASGGSEGSEGSGDTILNSVDAARGGR